MRHRIIGLIVGIAILLASPSAFGFSGTDLYKHCQKRNGGPEEIACAAFVHGFLDGMFLGYSLGRDKDAGFGYCPPEKGVSVDQGRLVVEKYLREHPEKLHEQAGLLVGWALVGAFRCK
jgi:hypothetical protein